VIGGDRIRSSSGRGNESKKGRTRSRQEKEDEPDRKGGGVWVKKKKGRRVSATGAGAEKNPSSRKRASVAASGRKLRPDQGRFRKKLMIADLHCPWQGGGWRHRLPYGVRPACCNPPDGTAKEDGLLGPFHPGGKEVGGKAAYSGSEKKVTIGETRFLRKTALCTS